MSKKRKHYSSKEKFQIVLELLRGRKTQAQITAEYGVHSTQQTKWKDEFMEFGESIFSKSHDNTQQLHQDEVEKLQSVIGQYVVEVNWLKKKIGTL